MVSFELNNFLVIHDKKEFLSYLRKNKLTKEKLLVSHFHKKDLFSGEPLEYKNEDHYLNNDFNCRDNLNNYLLSLNKIDAKNFCIDFLKKRKERKNLIFAPSQIELKSYIAPSINIIHKGLKLDYQEIIKEVGFLPRFNYKGKFKSEIFGPMTIIQDTREQKPLDFQNIKINKLDFGDYTVLPPYYSGVFIERKSLADLIGSLCPKNIDRFKSELARAVEMKSYLIVVIEESFSQLLRMKELRHIKSQASPDYILHKIREIMESSNIIQFLFVSNRQESARVIQKIFKLGQSVKQLDLTYAYDMGKL